MAKAKKIPCRVCGKLFKPCGYCQSHKDIFRWRNFACSKECAQKYISETIAYRESQNKNITSITTFSSKEEIIMEKEKYKKCYKKKSVEVDTTDVTNGKLEE